MNISNSEFSNGELLQLLNETDISIVITAGENFSSANSAFLELTGLTEEDLKGRGYRRAFDSESIERITRNQRLISETRKKQQKIRTVDRKLLVGLSHEDGRKIKCLMMLNLINTETEDKWLCQMIEQPTFYGERGERERVEQMVRLKDYLLNISQSLIRLENIQNFYSLVLEAAEKTIEQADYCSIMRLVDNDKFVPVASRGYSWEVMEEFELPVELSFSWMKLGHLLDQTIVIDDIDSLCCPDQTLVEVQGYKIRSTLQTPILLNEELYGILSIDSSLKNAFTEDDFNSIEYLRTQIQIALENQLLYNKMMHQASHDELTDVVSRGAFEEQVITFLRNRQHYESCCIIMIDLNDLKTVNDYWGHAAGDRLLLEFVRVMQKSMRGTDLLARLGGDEFAICFFSSQSVQFIERLTDIQKYFVEHPIAFEDRDVSCYFSYGISFCPEDGESYDTLLNKADKRMYAKKAELKKKKLKNDLHDLRQTV
ncbi:MAG: diguanylate cyclase [Spirochaetales bacterium]|nr:diguanylate cyclase [Spirochaetales bacterium]